MSENEISNLEVDIKELIKTARQEKKMSMAELGSKTGLSASYIQRLETGQRKSPSYMILKKLFDALDLDIKLVYKTSENEEEYSFTTLMLERKILIMNKEVSELQKSLISNLINEIYQCSWTEETKIKDSFKILEIVEQLKKNIKKEIN